jgi:DNA-binding GntR family transcriptional regulator
MARPSAASIDKAFANAPPPVDPAAAGTTLAAQITDRLREAITDGRFALGEALSELRLAAALQVSRTPVRDALTALQIEGLIEVRPQAGSFVYLPSEQDVGELAEFRRVMEVTALRFCHARRRDDALKQMRAAADSMERARDADDKLGMARADTAFHQAIAENSANTYLIQAYRLAAGRVAALRTFNLMGQGASRTRTMQEHRQVITAFARGDLDEAEDVLSQHILTMRIVYQGVRLRRAKGPALSQRG